MNRNRPPQLLKLVMALECVLLAAFVLLLSPVGDKISDSVPASGSAGAGQDKSPHEAESTKEESEQKKGFIKWVDFQVTKEAMQQAFRYDVDTCQSEIHLNWIELLAYLGARYGGDFSRYKAADMDTIAKRLQEGEKLEEITEDMKYYAYYLEAYTAVLGGMVGEFQVEIPASEAPEFALKGTGQNELSQEAKVQEETRQEQPGSKDPSQSQETQEEAGQSQPDGETPAQEGETKGSPPESRQQQESQDGPPESDSIPFRDDGMEDGNVWVTKYGLKAFSPIAKNYPYNDYDDDADIIGRNQKTFVLQGLPMKSYF